MDVTKIDHDLHSNKLTHVQQSLLLEMIVEGYGDNAIIAEFKKREYPSLSKRYLRYLTQRYRVRIDRNKLELVTAALERGLANKETRILRLIKLAERIEPDVLLQTARGNYPLLAQYRGILHDIADELGDRQGDNINNNTTINFNVNAESIDRIRREMKNWDEERFLVDANTTEE